MFPCREGLSFRDSNLSHHFVDAPSPGEKDRVVARRIGAVAADSEGGIDGKPFLRRDPRLVEPAEARKCGRKIEMRGVEIPVDLDRMAQLRDGVCLYEMMLADQANRARLGTLRALFLDETDFRADPQSAVGPSSTALR